MRDPISPVPFISDKVGGENRLEFSRSREHSPMPLGGLLCQFKIE